MASVLAEGDGDGLSTVSASRGTGDVGHGSRWRWFGEVEEVATQRGVEGIDECQGWAPKWRA